MQPPLNIFHPLVAKWFQERYGKPTDIQIKSWPIISRNEHVLITAPTGSGKTLTAFLWTLNQLITGKLQTGATRVLYISPLKALNNDIQRNLIDPLESLRRVFHESNQVFPDIKVLTRSGDTPQTERRRMLRHPPEILITTPESLNLMLSSRGGRSILGHVATVILDEIHALVSEKRGTYLMTAVDRLVPLSGEFQRVALSATLRPLEKVAEFVGGYRMMEGSGEPAYLPRPVSMIRSTASKRYEIGIELTYDLFSEPKPVSTTKKDIWEPIVQAIKSRIATNRSTLVFVNSRKLCEKITFLINRKASFPLAYAHHGSLSRELRYAVEHKLKQGELKAIVATHSLELGIDIGELDEVVLVQSPPSIASALQRMGRAGHRVEAVSKGVLFPTHAHDFLESAVLAHGIATQDIEHLKPVECPLDVLSQIIVSMTGTEIWDLDQLYFAVKTSWPYHHLSREQFELVLNMLAGRYADARIRELNTRVSIDRTDNTVKARKGALLTLYMSGGVIPDRGYFSLRHAETNARIGELDEEFVWEARIGQVLTLGNQNWKIERITHNDVYARPGTSGKTAPPFWIAEAHNRNFHLSERIGRFLNWANETLHTTQFIETLKTKHHMDDAAAHTLTRFLSRQKEKTGCDLPHRFHLLVENISSGPGGAPGNQIVLHTFWGGRVNRPYAMAFEAVWKERFKQAIEAYADNNCIYLILPHEVSPEELIAMVTQNRVLELIRSQLEGSGFFGARFRECAGRALLISHKKINERLPLWVSRLKSKRLFEAVAGYDDFPILLETWRTCLRDMFDLDSLQMLLAELESGEIKCHCITRSHPSPMALSGSWRQINEYMYRDDSRKSATRSRMREDLISGLFESPGFRADFTRGLIERFESKRKREGPGYAPDTPRDLLDWVVERVIIPYNEWETLLRKIENDHRIPPQDILAPLEEKICCLRPQGASTDVIVARENTDAVCKSLYDEMERIAMQPLWPGCQKPTSAERELRDVAVPEPAEIEQTRVRLIGEWLSFYGPMTVHRALQKMGVTADLFHSVLNDLVASGRILKGCFTEDVRDEEICDKENFAILLRMKRVDAVPVFEPLPITRLPGFIATIQGVAEKTGDKKNLYVCMEQLSGYCAPAGMWESEILPARLDPYDTSWLDTVMQESELMWVGCGKEKIFFCFESDLPLFMCTHDNAKTEKRVSEETAPHTPKTAIAVEHDEIVDHANLLEIKGVGYDFNTLQKKTNLPAHQLAEQLWASVWDGMLTNDTFLSMRKGIAHRFRMEGDVLSKEHQWAGRRRTYTLRRPRTSRQRYRKRIQSLAYAGNWCEIAYDRDTADLIETAEDEKERVRLLLDRYGILFRELLTREQTMFQWRRIFKSLRLMELSGEIVSGYFFHDVPGPQFMSHSGFQRLQRLSLEGKVFWINAQDPASLCGIDIKNLKQHLPKRLPGTHLVYRGEKRVLVSRRNGKELTFETSEKDPDVQSCLGLFHHLMTRQFKPHRQITIETINGTDAAKSPYVDLLRISFEVIVDYKHVVLYKKGV